MHLLVIEDERALCETIVRSLRRLAYSVDYCYDGEKALEFLGVERYDLVLLDLNLPKKDGMTVLRTLRQTDRETRVLILSARSEVEDKVQGLDAGANDYLAKPFHLAELEARIRSLTLRQFTQKDVILTCGGLTFDTRSSTAAVNEQSFTLTPGPKPEPIVVCGPANEYLRLILTPINPELKDLVGKRVRMILDHDGNTCIITANLDEVDTYDITCSRVQTDEGNLSNTFVQWHADLETLYVSRDAVIAVGMVLSPC